MGVGRYDSRPSDNLGNFGSGISPVNEVKLKGKGINFTRKTYLSEVKKLIHNYKKFQYNKLPFK